MHKRQWFNIMTSADSNQAEIFIYGIIGNSWWDDEANSASNFVSEFKELEKKYDRINIRINSPGGDIWEGLPIINAIKASKKDIHTYVDGIAYSMGFQIAIAGNTVHAAKNALLLAHSASTIEWGNAKSLRKTADELDKYDAALATTLQSKIGGEIEDIIAKYFNYEDHLFTSQEALDLGFIDIREDYEAERPEVEKMTTDQVFNYYLNSEENPFKKSNSSISFFEKSKQRIAAIINPNPNSKPKNMFENLDKLFAAIKNGENISDEIKAQAASEIAASGLTLITAEEKSNFDGLQSKVDDLQKQIDNNDITNLFENNGDKDFDLATAVKAVIEKAKQFDALDGDGPDKVIKDKDNKDERNTTPDWSRMAHHQKANQFLNSKI